MSTCWKCRDHCQCPLTTGGIGRIASAIALALLLAGCASARTAVETVTIDVPVAVHCDPPAVAAPALPIDALAPEANLFEIDRALWASFELLLATVDRLNAAIDACRSPGP